MIKYAIASDIHLHNWSAFSDVNQKGVNTRLSTILGELSRAAEVAVKEGCKRLYITGDLFHVRGSISPSVLNPTIETFDYICGLDLEVRVLAGNHDLESNNSNALSNAAEALRSVIGVEVVSRDRYFKDDKVLMVPWINSVKALKERLEELSLSHDNPSEITLMIHAPVDGVIDGLPDHGLSGPDLESYGFKRVISGHYHNHKRVSDSVWSVGALTHQTWGDVGTEAGFMIADESGISHFPSEAPAFVDLTAKDLDDDDTAIAMCSGNYVRVKLDEATHSEVSAIRDAVTNDYGAVGVIIQAQPKNKVVTRSAATVNAGASLEVSIADFIKGQTLRVKTEDVQSGAESVLSEMGVE